MEKATSTGLGFGFGFALGTVIGGSTVYFILMDEARRRERATARVEARLRSPAKAERHRLAWKGAWDRPMKVDEDSLDPLTSARMTDHNVRGKNGG